MAISRIHNIEVRTGKDISFKRQPYNMEVVVNAKGRWKFINSCIDYIKKKILIRRLEYDDQ